MSQKRGNIFPENTFGRNRHCCTKISGIWGPKHFVGCPKNGETFSQKTRLAENGTSNGHFYPKMGTNVHFSARRFWINSYADIFKSIYHIEKCVLKKFRKLPSARRIFPKVFRRSHFWTSNSCPFSQKFFESCAKSNKK